MEVLPVILAGGSGSRLWPLSRDMYPKQFLSLVPGQQSLLQETISRLEGLDFRAPLVVCSEEHRFIAAEQLRKMGREDCPILLEPSARNTAPAAALASFFAISDLTHDKDLILLVLSADHFIADVSAFRHALQSAVNLAKLGKLVTCGVLPTAPETGYGYIERGAPFEDGFEVNRFVEKPDLVTAQKFIDSGSFVWNSGIFVFKAKTFLKSLQSLAPQIFEACKASTDLMTTDMTFTRVNRSEFERCSSEAIDTAVMEKSKDVVMVTLDAGWSDLGSWPALWQLADKDVSGNVLQGDVLAEDCRGVYVNAQSRLVAAIGLDDLVVIETKDAVLVAHKTRAQDVKKIHVQLKNSGRPEYKNHPVVYRPWGMYECIDAGDSFQVKRITVEPGAKLSLQMHHHRAEHWVVVSGTAEITNGEKTYLLQENESTYIPVGQRHALKNPGNTRLEIIEVQSGAYLGEDDIVRFEDLYGRK